MTFRESIRLDAQKRLDNLIDFSARRREWYQEQRLRIVDRQSTQISLISSISATILAITAALPSQKVSGLIDLAFVLLLISTIGGIVLILWSTHFDEKTLKESRDEEIPIFDRLKGATKSVTLNPTIKEYEKHAKVFRDEDNQITELQETHKSEKTFLNLLYWVVLVAFMLGIISLALVWFTGKNTSVDYQFNHTTKDNHYRKYFYRERN